jgi:ABC-2 type transport system ATP-binding protein
MDYAIETRNLEKVFGEKRVVKNINLNVAKGTIFGLIGPNGAGKTTTIRMLLGILKPSSGEAIVLGQNSSRDGVKLRQSIGYVAEQNIFYPYMTVDELIKFNQGLFPRWSQETARHYLDRFDLPPKTKVGHLSKGMKAQLGLTLALAVQPELLILDEPTSSLDPVWRRKFLQVITDAAATQEMTVFFSSHILSDVERVADTVGILINGQLQVMRSIDELKHNERVVRVVFQGSAPEGLLATEGIASIQRQGNGYLLNITDNFDEIYTSLSKTPHFVLEVLEQDLESIFLDYADRGGSNRA